MNNKIGIRALCFLVAIMAGLSYLVIQSVYDSFVWKSHTHEVKEKIERIVGLSIEAQTSIRGFVISKNRDFLVGYHQVSPIIMNEVTDLKTLTKDNPNQQINCDKLSIIISNKLEVLGRTLTLANMNNFEKASAAITSGEGEKLVRQLKTLSGQMLEIENNLLVERQMIVDRNYNYAYYGMPSLVILCVVTLIVSSILEKSGV